MSYYKVFHMKSISNRNEKTEILKIQRYSNTRIMKNMGKNMGKNQNCVIWIQIVLLWT